MVKLEIIVVKDLETLVEDIINVDYIKIDGFKLLQAGLNNGLCIVVTEKELDGISLEFGRGWNQINIKNNI